MTTETTSLSLTDAEIARAKQIWQDYQKAHDVTSMRGWAAGIDPATGEVWFGKDLGEIYDQRVKRGLTSPLFVERVGARTYLRKGSHVPVPLAATYATTWNVCPKPLQRAVLAAGAKG